MLFARTRLLSEPYPRPRFLFPRPARSHLGRVCREGLRFLQPGPGEKQQWTLSVDLLIDERNDDGGK
jgi:hypothetical protein